MTTESFLLTTAIVWFFDSFIFKSYYWMEGGENKNNIYHKTIETQEDVAFKILAWLSPIGGVAMLVVNLIGWIRSLPPK